MVYDTDTVLTRYKQLQDLPEGGETAESLCSLAGGAQAQQTAGCEPGACQSCCLGMVELVRRYSEQCTEPLETSPPDDAAAVNSSCSQPGERRS